MKKILGIGFAAMLLFGALAGCGGPGGEEEDVPLPTGTEGVEGADPAQVEVLPPPE